MPTYQSQFTGPQMDTRFAAVPELQEAITALEAAVAAKYAKPAGGIPSTDLDADVNAALAKALTAVQDLSNYYTKAETDAIASAISATVASFNAEVVVSLPTASASTMGKFYLVGPDGDGEYDRYVTSYDGNSYAWVPAGTTDIDLSQYATKAELDQLDQEVNEENQISLYQKQYNQPVKYELGSISISNSGWTYAATRNRVRTPQNYILYLLPGDVIGLSSYTDARFYWGCRDLDGNYTSPSAWRTSDYTCVTEGYYVILVSNSSDRQQSSADDLGSLIQVQRKTTPGFLRDKVLDIKLDFAGNGSTSVNKDFKTTVGKVYDVFLPETTWTVAETTNTATVVFIVRTKSGTTYTDIASTRVYRSDFDVKKKIYSFQATTDTSNLFIRADASQNLTFYIREQYDPSVVGNYILAKKNDYRLDTMQVLTQCRYIHHLNVEDDNAIIPSQSLYDIAYAKALGFKAIEANIKKCSDGVYVVKHGGSSNSLGVGLSFAAGSGLSSSTKFSEVSSTDLRTYVSYDSAMSKYRGHIPTLAEFCQECAKLGMTPFLRGADLDSLAEARKYLPDEQLIVEWSISHRMDIKGMMTIWDAGATVDAILEKCAKYGRPFYYAWSNDSIVAASDELITNVFQALHKNGYAVGTSYLNQNNYQRLRKKGLDVFAPNYRIIPPFYVGNVLNIIGGSDENLTFQDAVYNQVDDTITMENGGTIKVSNELIGESFSKCSVRIRYSGTLSVAFKGYNQIVNLVSYASDGADTIEVAAALEKIGADFLTITANAATTVYDIAIFASVVM